LPPGESKGKFQPVKNGGKSLLFSKTISAPLANHLPIESGRCGLDIGRWANRSLGVERWGVDRLERGGVR
jgi:hypothetical protein